jgi:hypothetical protein
VKNGCQRLVAEFVPLAKAPKNSCSSADCDTAGRLSLTILAGASESDNFVASVQLAPASMCAAAGKSRATAFAKFLAISPHRKAVKRVLADASPSGACKTSSQEKSPAEAELLSLCLKYSD